MDNLLMILLGFVIVYMFKNMCGKRVEGWGTACGDFWCDGASCNTLGSTEECRDHSIDDLTCQLGISYHNTGGRAGNRLECRVDA